MNEKDKELAQKFKRIEQAYTQPVKGSDALLQLDAVYWTEALLLKVIRSLYRQRLQQIQGITAQIPNEFDE